jgi:hypothetical protein
MAQQVVSCYNKQGISCYTVTLCLIVIFASNFVQATNMRTYRRKMNRGAVPRETYVNTAKEVLAKTRSL